METQESLTVTDAAKLFMEDISDDLEMSSDVVEEVIEDPQEVEEEVEASEEIDEVEEKGVLADDEESEDIEEPELDETGQWMQELQETLTDNPDFLDELQLKIGDGSVKLADVKKANMLQADYTKKTQALSDERKAFTDATEQAQQAVVEKLQTFDAYNQALEKQLVDDHTAINWEELRQYDPAEFAAKKQEFGERSNKLQQTRESAMQQAVQAKQEIMNVQREACIKSLLGSIPEWKDEGARTKGFETVKNTMLNDYGINPTLVGNIVDAGIIMMAKDAAAYRAGKTASETKKPALKKLPKFVKAGAKQTKASTKTKQLRRSTQLKKSGKLKDAAAVFYDML